MLPPRKLGTQGLEVSALGLGCMGMSQSYGVPDDQESVATLHRAIDLGVTFLDTAEAYGPFTNEELLGRALKGRREQVVLATKFGFRFEGKQLSGTDSRPKHIRDVAEASLRRLRTDRIDLLYRIHYLQWTGIKKLDNVLGMLGIALVIVLTTLGAWLAFKRS